MIKHIIKIIQVSVCEVSPAHTKSYMVSLKSCKGGKLLRVAIDKKLLKMYESVSIYAKNFHSLVTEIHKVKDIRTPDIKKNQENGTNQKATCLKTGFIYLRET